MVSLPPTVSSACHPGADGRRVSLARGAAALVLVAPSPARHAPRAARARLARGVHAMHACMHTCWLEPGLAMGLPLAWAWLLGCRRLCQRPAQPCTASGARMPCLRSG